MGGVRRVWEGMGGVGGMGGDEKGHGISQVEG